MRNLKRSAAVLASAAAVLAVSACGSDDPAAPRADTSGSSDPAGTPDTADTSDSGQADEDVQVPDALRFSTTTVTGEEFDGATLAGSPAVLWFWAPWCTVCQGEAPGIKAAQQEWGDQVTFVGIPGNGSPQDDLDFVNTYELEDFTHARDTDGSLWSGFDVVSQPAFAFIDAEGQVETVPGAMSEQELDSRLADLANG